MPLVAVFGDQNSHGNGNLTCDNNPSKLFVAGKLVALKDSSALADMADHPTPPTDASQGTSKLFVAGIEVHLDGQSRYCGASTIVTNNSGKMFSG